MDVYSLLSSHTLILASASPRRRDLLAAAGLPCVVRPSHIPEVRLPGEEPAAYVLRLAREKAHAVPVGAGELILAADTTVVAGDEVLEKPVDGEDAARILSRLSGRAHEVLTGICVRAGGCERTAVERTGVWFGEMSEDDIGRYVASGEPMDKAGAYGIQGMASRWITRVEGCYVNVVGLPVSLLWREISALAGEMAD